MPKQSKVTLAAVTLDMAKTSARLYASAASRHAKADGDFMALAVKSVEGLPKLTAEQWDRQLRKVVKAALSEPRKGLSAASVSSYLSSAKVLQLGALHGITPIAGESRKDAISRISEALSTAKDGDAFVWPASTRNGRPAKAKGAKAGDKPGGAFDPAAAAILRAGGLSSTDASEEGFNRSPAMAAALILTKGNEARAQRVRFILESHAELFDRWAETILTDDDKAAIAARSKAQGEAAKGSEVVTLKPDAPLPAVGAALVKAQAKANARKARKAA